MQTPKSRINSSGSAPRISPQSVSSEVSVKNSPPAASSEPSKKHSPRVVRQLKTSPRYSEHTVSSSNIATRPPKEKSPRVSEHKAPTSPPSENKPRSKVSELKSQISELENELKNVKDQLTLSEESEKQAKKDAEESSQQLLVLSSKLEESKKKLLEQSASQNARTIELSETAEVREKTLHESAALDEIKRLQAQLEMVAQSEAALTSHSNYAETELQKLKEDFVETNLVVEEMKNQLNDCKKSEARAQELVIETLMQLDAAKKMVETLRSDGCKQTEANDAVASELEESRARVKSLEDLIAKFKSEAEESDFTSVKLEVEQLRSALAVAEIRQKEEQTRSTEQIKHAYEMVEQIKSVSGQREAELEAELRRSSYEIEQLRSNMMDKETDVQSIFEENDSLILQLENMKSKQYIISKENETLKLEMKEANEALSKMEGARAAEREALMKVEYMAEEVEKSKRKAARVEEQLEAAQAANAEMEGELRKLKVQSDQWRKAAEVAASMLAVGRNGNGQAVERTGSMDSNYVNRLSSPYAEEVDDDLLKKKNANMLRRFGGMWKKPHK